MVNRDLLILELRVIHLLPTKKTFVNDKKMFKELQHLLLLSETETNEVI